MNRLLIALAAVLLYSACLFGLGWAVRDSRADATTAKRDTADAQAQTQVVTKAREDDHASERVATKTEENRVEQQTAHEVTFSKINQDVFTYAQQHARADDGCTDDGADDDFMRTWNAAQAGRSADGEHQHPARADAGRSAGAAGASKR